MHRSVSRALRGLAALMSLTFLSSGLVACEQGAAHEEEHSDDAPELAFGQEELLAQWTLEGDYYVSPELEAPMGATRVAVLLSTLELDEAMPELQARDAENAGDWTEIRNTWSEEGQHVGIADIEGGTTSVQVRLPASAVEAIDSIVFNAVIPATPDSVEYDEPGPDELGAGGEVGVVGAELRSDLAALGVRSRASWGARSGRGCSRDTTRRYRFAVHHTVSPQTGDLASRVRGFQRFHQDGNGWCDIGYHFLVGADGTVFEGRPLEQLGAHVGGHNSGNIGFSFIGCFDGTCPSSLGSRIPSDRAIRAAARVMHRLSRVYGITISSRNVLGHRQHSGQGTACPGTNLLARLDTIRSLARSGSGGAAPAPTPTPSRSPSTVRTTWTRGSDRTYTFTSNVASQVVRVDYYVDGWRIGTVRRSASSEFRARYRFSSETRNRRFEARGYDAGGRIVGRGYGLIEPVGGTAIAIRQTAHATYEFSVERAPAGVRSIQVSVDDGFVLRDSVSNATRSTRMAVRYQFVGLRARPFQIKMYDAGGNLVRTERRTFTLR